MARLSRGAAFVEATTRQIHDAQKRVIIPPNYFAAIPWLAGLAALNVTILWAVGGRRRRQGNVSILAAAGVALLVSLALHLLAVVMKGIEFALAWGMLTVPLMWGFGFLANLLAKFGWERYVRNRG